ncbi:hypothetical protein [Chryseobacterium vaccae]|uniref:hypothetical protein n=1 Tax=Chryseobacterium vaccae TaxID=2604424 RepID=UPI001294887B|nr:hypothetical protein [Chryseobacterium vaccae]
MKVKNLLILFFTSVLILSCNKTSSESKENASQLNDTVSIPKDSASQTKNNTKYTPRGGTFGALDEDGHNSLRNDYDKIFNGSNLQTKVFEINSASFNEVVNKYNTSKKFLDIYFILDKTGQRNLMFKFTSEPKGENFVLKSGDHQYIIVNKDLQPADSEKLLDLNGKFETKYANELGLSPSQPTTILVRDVLADINDVYGTLKIYPCLDSGRISLTSEYKDASGKTIYGNRGSLYP